MNHIQRGILALIRSGLTGKAHPLPENFSLAEALPLIKEHQIVGLAYEGAVLCGIGKQEPAMQELFQIYCLILMRSEKQLRALNKLFAEFEAAGIDYLTVKGCNLKALFPKPELRSMGDADILIHAEQYDAIQPIVERLGYTYHSYFEGVYVWTGPAILLELHKYLMPEGNLDFHRYFSDSWKRAVHLDGHRYALKAEDEFVFLFVHYAKHYRSGGIGIRQLIDLWLWQEKHQMDMDYVRAELGKLKLAAFFDNTQKMLRVWFADADGDAKTDFISDFIFASGSWGKLENRQMASGLKAEHQQGSRSGGRVKLILQAFFPPVSEMDKRYPVLKKAPWLLPLVWPVRWVSALLFRRKNIRNFQASVENTADEKLDNFARSLQYVGLDFDF